MASWRCTICKYNPKGDSPPDRCPVCGGGPDKFERVDAAAACVDAGAAVVAVSNHGGRVLDGTPGVAEVLRPIVERVGGRVAITADGGVRTGYDVLKLLALGATAVLIGRDVIRAAIGGGPKGVELQMARLGSVLKKGMLMTGCPDLASIDRDILA